MVDGMSMRASGGRGESGYRLLPIETSITTGYRRCAGRVGGVGLRSDFLRLHVADDDVDEARHKVEVGVARWLGGWPGW
jgi:hypothetical protein